jgi:hypothetical protein
LRVTQRRTISDAVNVGIAKYNATAARARVKIAKRRRRGRAAADRLVTWSGMTGFLA